MKKHLLISAATLCIGVPAHATILVDDFSTAIDATNGGITLTNEVGSGTTVTFLDDNPTPIPGTIGSRFWTLEEPAGSVGAQTEVFIDASGVLDLNFANNPGITEALFSVRYDDFGTVDFTAGGEDRFAVEVEFLDITAPEDITLSIGVETATGTGESTIAFSGFVLPSNPLTLEFFYSAFTTTSGTLDFTQVEAITLEASSDSVLAPDLALDNFAAVPEPSTYAALFGAAALALAFLRRRLRARR
jgi:hypothetical protein